MWAILRREWFIFFSTPVGYLTVAFFLTLSTLFLWFLDTDFNILSAGFADLNTFFVLAPWLLLFLIPALCMRSFLEEKRLGTLELLLTKPLNMWQIVLGKYLAIILLLLVTLLPTLVYFFAIEELKLESTPIDWGSALTAYLGLLLVGASFVALGLLSSLVANSQASAFIIALILCFVQFYVWKGTADLMLQKEFYRFFNGLGIFEHYLSLRQGVIALKDLVYFLGFNYIVLYCNTLILFKIKNH
ncbi:MAG: gliding motility-associated ABC transporter permease subunit GldF [Flavobacteriaceae bacterium]|nr:gliding motility-associated ABC transporter permease subunit GldF [Flavobacteriaceae bacterium]|tara:strand:- start:1449 stop:2183 length:735 start_codon:yes stop_codon:yes gene_type:complete